MKEYTKSEAIEKSREFLNELQLLEEKYSLSLNSDTGDVYISFKKSDRTSGYYWGSVNIGWEGDGTGLKVMEKTEEDIKNEALSKLTEEERKALGV